MKLLDQFSEDLVSKAASLDPVIGREKEIETVIGILSRKRQRDTGCENGEKQLLHVGQLLYCLLTVIIYYLALECN